MRESSVAGTAKRANRVNDVARGGTVLPIPWKTLELVKTIPTAMKFNEMTFR